MSQQSETLVDVAKNLVNSAQVIIKISQHIEYLDSQVDDLRSRVALTGRALHDIATKYEQERQTAAEKVEDLKKIFEKQPEMLDMAGSVLEDLLILLTGGETS
jgi:archaellum component FlaC